MCKPADSGYLDLGEVSLYYRDYLPQGARGTLLLLHGNGGSWRSFLAQIGPFTEAGYRVITLDSRAQGRSGRGTAPMTPPQLAADALAAMDRLGAGRVAVVGFSDGGNLALQMALAQPGRLWALVAAGPNLTPAGVALPWQLSFELQYALNRFKGSLSLDGGRHSLYPHCRRRAQVLELVVGQPQMTFAQLRGLQLPALILGGERDIMRRGHLLHIAAALPQGRVKILQGAPHQLFSEPWAGQANQAVLDFLDEAVPAPLF